MNRLKTLIGKFIVATRVIESANWQSKQQTVFFPVNSNAITINWNNLIKVSSQQIKPSGNSDLRKIRKDKGSFSSIEISNHLTLREHWPVIISRWY
jgi:hypothetical protein